MKNLRTVAIAVALSAIATLAALPTVRAGEASVNAHALHAAVPVPMCPPNDPNGCGIYR